MRKSAIIARFAKRELILQALTTILDFIRWGASRFNQAGLFFGHGTECAIDEAAALVLHTLHLPHDLHPSWLQGRLTQAERDQVTALIQKRIETRMPLPYLLGEAWFAGLAFKVNPHVLIPRSPIAELIETGFSPWLEAEREDAHVLDLCCGSGCIGIATAVFMPDCRVDLADISVEALAVCAENIQLHQVSDRVRAVNSDLFAALQGRTYDLILSNPPYVGEREMAGLPDEYHHEPVLALQAEDEGLEIVKRILRQASNYLAPGGILIVEVGNSADLLQQAYPEIPFVWLEFERGGSGVFLLSADTLRQHAEHI